MDKQIPPQCRAATTENYRCEWTTKAGDLCGYHAKRLAAGKTVRVLTDIELQAFAHADDAESDTVCEWSGQCTYYHNKLVAAFLAGAAAKS